MKVNISKRLQRLGTIKAGENFCLIESAIPHYYMRVSDCNFGERRNNFIPVVELATGVLTSFSMDTQVIPIRLKVEEDYED